MIGIKEKIGCHTLRKTFGYHARLNGTPIEKLQKIFNHSATILLMFSAYCLVFVLSFVRKYSGRFGLIVKLFIKLLMKS